MSTLKSTLETLASQFAMSILNALRSASIEEVMGVTGARSTAAAGTSAASAPAKRGPGRPKKAAAAPAAEAPAPAAPKKRGRPAGSGRAASSAASSAPTKAKTTSTGRLARRSVDDIGQVLESIVSLVQQHPDGLRAEQIRGALGLDAKELPRPLADGIANGSLTKTGQKRATTYFAGGGRGGKKRGR